ncbi:MAG: type II secretion system F family protein [Chloroflexi bacterium]|nr:type II secretion system F family protein [Chloroflexota bacterium]MBU1751946.1 type II secretion system F family protein [Chloroflexota bacterium]MBU1878624.1 type II secretion system F family protein [Chloroflexota bacterium]
MDLLAVALAGSAALTVLMIVLGIALPSRQENPIQSRLGQYATRPRTLEEMELEQPFLDRVVKPIVGWLARIIMRYTPQRSIENTRHNLILAGNPNNWQASDFMGLKGLFALILGAVVTVLLFLYQGDLLWTIGGGLIGAGLGYYLPTLWLSSKISSRKTAITKALPDALDLLCICVEAGLGFDAAMSKVTEKWDNDLAREFGRVIAEVRVGKLRREALRDMVTRTEVPDVSNFIAAIIQAEQLGVSIGRVLQIQADQMRVKRRQRAEEQAQQAAVKMLFPMIFLILPSIFVVILGPSVPIILEALQFGVFSF